MTLEEYRQELLKVASKIEETIASIEEETTTVKEASVSRYRSNNTASIDKLAGLDAYGSIETIRKIKEVDPFTEFLIS